MLGETVLTPSAEWLLAIAGIITALTVIGKALQYMRKRARRMEEFFDDYFGTPADPVRGKPEQPGVMARLTAGEAARETLQESLDENTGLVKQLKDRVEYEMSTNGGGSMRDEVRDLSVEQSRQGKQIKEIRESADATHRMLSERIAALEAIDAQKIIDDADKAHEELAGRIRALENPKKENGNDDPQP